MPVINEDTRAAWQSIADRLSLQRPNPGERVVILGGRKYRGKRGTVVRNEQDRFDDALRYGSAAHHHIIVMARRAGFVVLVQPDGRAKRFWVKASYVVCLDGNGYPRLTDAERDLFEAIRDAPGKRALPSADDPIYNRTMILNDLRLIELRRGQLWPHPIFAKS